MTPGVMDAFSRSDKDVRHYLRRHMTGDWGDLGSDDKHANEIALEDGSRIFSAYNLSTDERIWVITEADRSATTFLLPGEY